MKNKQPYITIFLLTALDALLTTIGINLKIIEEANPLFKGLFEYSPILASFIAVSIVGILLVLVYKYRSHIKWIDKGLILATIIKVGVIGLHIRWIVYAIMYS